MQNNVLEYLEKTVQRVPDKVAFANDKYEIDFKTVYNNARAIGSFLYNEGYYKQPIVVFMEKQPKAIVAFFGALYGGGYYVPLDEEMPKHRIELIFESLKPQIVICDEKTHEQLDEFSYEGIACLYDDIINSKQDETALGYVREHHIDTDPMYIVFTSGSTGVPKGVVACHRSVIDYVEQLSETLQFDENTVFGNQSPLYFDACLKEIYPTIKFGATTYLIPKNLFMFPIKLVEFLNEKSINTICWVVSALTMISGFAVFEKVIPDKLTNIAFGSEVFPIKQFKLWRRALPNARFTNLYGPTECTGMSCYYKVDRDFELDEAIPIGRPFKNTDIILLDENDKVPPKGQPGEICIRGTALTLGYYKNFEKTNEVFVQNPLNDMYPELIYRTGDIGKYNEYGELVFISRKDYQIKHMGHRIELGEIEVIVNMLEEIQSSCCVFDNYKKKIVLYYVGEIEKADVIRYVKQKLPRYMVPNVTEKLEMMPLTSNGKINRKLLQEKLKE